MPRHIELEGLAAIDIIVARSARAIAEQWDGGNERVGFIVGRGEEVAVGFRSRGEAALELRRMSDQTIGSRATRLREIASGLERGAPERGVQCVLLGFGDPIVVEIEPDDLRGPTALGRPLSNEELAGLYAACATREGALAEVAALRVAFRAATEGEIPELEQLERALDQRYGDQSAVAIAIGRARAATDPLLPTPAGQRARLVLDLLGEATAQRGSVRVNASGGSA